MTITTLLIANRGEIARRIIKTARQMGTRTVAVYSDADRDAPHVRDADTAFHIGPAEAAQSYLNGPRIIQVALKSGANAIHPGYGFLSENAEFAQACTAAGLRFVGPSPDLISTMGSKIEAKKHAIAAGVPVVTGYDGADQSDAVLMDRASQIGFPLLIKASAGGGGRGMRVVDQAPDMPTALASARAEAKAGFGDDTLLLERYVRAARHIEVQIFGDEFGNAVHLFERDCSLQRNHQKVIEEAPAPNLAEPLRREILASAVRLANAVGYQNAGTVEYLLDPKTDEYFFLEMNTRLQVEHPVTELITGIDLVEQMIRVAAGETLPLKQADITCTGWAIEARVAAEDPANGYQPQTGEISDVTLPRRCRTDSGVERGSVVTHHYDSMLAKVIAQAPTRHAAIAQLVAGLQDMWLDGIGTNLAFLTDLLASTAFAKGTHATCTIADLYPDGWQLPPVTDQLRAVAVLARYLADRPAAQTPWQQLGAWRSVSVGGRRGMSVYYLEDQAVEICETPVEMIVKLPDQPQITFEHTSLSCGRLRFEQAGQRHDIGVTCHGPLVEFSGNLGRANMTVRNAQEAFLTNAYAAKTNASVITAPMPGLVVEILKQAGTPINAGEPVIVIEAMKLLQTLVAPCDGVLDTIHFQAGDIVEKQSLLASFTPTEIDQ